MRTTRVIAFSILAGIALGAGLVEALHAQGKPQAYVVGEINVIDPEGFAKEFSPLAPKHLLRRLATARSCSAAKQSQ